MEDLSARAKMIEVDGVAIVSLDFSNCSLEESPKMIDVAAKLVRSQPLGTALTLSNFTNAKFNSEITTKLRMYSNENKPYVKKAALVGITGIRLAIYRAVLLFTGRTNFVLCSSVEEAKRALVSAARP